MELLRYVTPSGTDVIAEWLDSIKDLRTRAKIAARFLRLAVGNFGDCKPLKQGVNELRIDWGPGYRVYYAKVSNVCVLLLCGGDKRKQSQDIERAVTYWNDYKQRVHTDEKQN